MASFNTPSLTGRLRGQRLALKLHELAVNYSGFLGKALRLHGSGCKGKLYENHKVTSNGCDWWSLVIKSKECQIFCSQRKITGSAVSALFSMVKFNCCCPCLSADDLGWETEWL